MPRNRLDTPLDRLPQYGTVAAESPTTSPAKYALELPQVPWARKFGIDYVQHFDHVAPFFAGDPASADAWRDAIARAQRHPRARVELVALLTAQQQGRQAPPAALAASARLADPASVAIVTGQQAGLFGGPVFTLLKALTAIKLARQIERDHGVPAVPVFWIDAEDHDWDEVSTCGVLDPDNGLKVITAPRPDGANEGPVARVKLDERITATLDELQASLPPTEFTGPLMDRLRAFYAPGAGMSTAFGCWVESLLGPLGLVLYCSADPAAKPLAAPVFLHELSTAGRTAALANKSGAEMEARGYHAQVTPSADTVALFHLNATREPIRLAEGGANGGAAEGGNAFVIAEQTIPADTLIAEAKAHPERFSPNVLLRPLVQDTLFPTIAYIGGPSELTYLGQLREVYAHFGIPMPLMYPRISATVLDAGATRFLSRYDLPLGTLQPQDEAALNALLESQLPPSVDAALQEAERTIEARMQAVVAAVPTIDPTLEGAAKSALGKMTHELTALHNKIIQAAKRRDETLRRQFVRARAQAFPGGDPQERAIGFITLINRYGPALVDLLDQELSPDLGRHWVLTL
jgi:bacillithiol biosynthesis cysteine-adding enzyme BshC